MVPHGAWAFPRVAEFSPPKIFHSPPPPILPQVRQVQVLRIQWGFQLCPTKSVKKKTLPPPPPPPLRPGEVGESCSPQGPALSEVAKVQWAHQGAPEDVQFVVLVD